MFSLDLQIQFLRVHLPLHLSQNNSSSRVGMLALENLGRRISEDRPQMKFARNPSYGDDVKWLLNISKKLGTPLRLNLNGLCYSSFSCYLIRI